MLIGIISSFFHLLLSLVFFAGGFLDRTIFIISITYGIYSYLISTVYQERFIVFEWKDVFFFILFQGIITVVMIYLGIYQYNSFVIYMMINFICSISCGCMARYKTLK